MTPTIRRNADSLPSCATRTSSASTSSDTSSSDLGCSGISIRQRHGEKGSRRLYRVAMPSAPRVTHCPPRRASLFHSRPGRRYSDGTILSVLNIPPFGQGQACGRRGRCDARAKKLIAGLVHSSGQGRHAGAKSEPSCWRIVTPRDQFKEAPHGAKPAKARTPARCRRDPEPRPG